MDDPCSEPRVLHENTQNKMVEHSESDIAIRFVDENDYTVIPARIVLAKGKLKKNRPSWHVFKHCYDVDSSEAESSREEDEVSASEEEAVTETDSASEIQENVESSYSNDSSSDEAKSRKVQGSLNLPLRVRLSLNQGKRPRRNQINGTRVFQKKRWRIMWTFGREETRPRRQNKGEYGIFS